MRLRRLFAPRRSTDAELIRQAAEAKTRSERVLMEAQKIQAAIDEIRAVERVARGQR